VVEDPDIAKLYPGSQTRRPQHPLIGDVATVQYGVTNGEFDRYNMMRMVSLTANYSGGDLGRVGEEVKAAIKRAGVPPHGVFADVTGQVPLLKDTFAHLLGGLVLGCLCYRFDVAWLLPGRSHCACGDVDHTSYFAWEY
jgi:multidrug efflux pump subunit AcrB